METWWYCTLHFQLENQRVCGSRLDCFLHRPVVLLFHIVSLFTQGVKMVTGNILLGLALRVTSEVY